MRACVVFVYASRHRLFSQVGEIAFVSRCNKKKHAVRVSCSFSGRIPKIPSSPSFIHCLSGFMVSMSMEVLLVPLIFFGQAGWKVSSLLGGVKPDAVVENPPKLELLPPGTTRRYKSWRVCKTPDTRPISYRQAVPRRVPSTLSPN